MEFLVDGIIVVIGIFVLLKAGKYVVRSLAAMARFLHVSEFILSFLLIAFATSLPELSVGLNSAFSGIPALSLGDIVGTNIVNFTLILGIVSVLAGKMELKDYKHFKENRAFHFMLVMAPLILLMDGVLSRLDGFFLLVLFISNILKLLDVDDVILGRKVLRPHLALHAHHTVDSKHRFVGNVFVFVIAVSVLLASSSLIVLSIEDISAHFGIPEILIGLFIIGIGTSLPELSIGIKSVKSERDGISLGDLFGSAVINSTLILGTVSMITPITITEPATFWVTVVFVALTLLLANYFLRKKSFVTRKEGIILIMVYVLFLSIQLIVYSLYR
ncbi:MAG: sodium:calcium antiporter [Candidatus Spechtbacterales bacterium]|nr:sodium:calcium antiporter [Candidatus Spechtbacterales bacterium]